MHHTHRHAWDALLCGHAEGRLLVALTLPAHQQPAGSCAPACCDINVGFFRGPSDCPMPSSQFQAVAENPGTACVCQHQPQCGSAVWAMREQLAVTGGAAATLLLNGAHIALVPQGDANPTGTCLQMPAAAAAVLLFLHAWQVCSALPPGRHAASSICHHQLGRGRNTARLAAVAASRPGRRAAPIASC